jgi:hypothetical protein
VNLITERRHSLRGLWWNRRDDPQHAEDDQRLRIARGRRRHWRILEALRPLGYVFVALPLHFEAGTPRERRIQRVSKIEGGHHLCVDLIIADASFAGLLEDTVDVELSEGPLVVVSRAGLTKMKRLASRPQDLVDLELLEDEDG